MVYAVLADVVMGVHFAFVVFVAAGGFAVLVRPRVAWAHVPCALYGAAIEFFGWTCPLTPLEIDLRRAAGQAGYSGSFLGQYLEGILYPAGWSDVHVWLGAAVLVGNGAIYGWAVWRRRRGRGRSGTSGPYPGGRSRG